MAQRDHVPKEENNDEQKELAESLAQVVHPSWENSQGQSYTISRLDLVAASVKAQVRMTMRAAFPDDYAEYKALKQKGLAPGEKPGLAQRREAYRFLFARFVDRAVNIPGL